MPVVRTYAVLDERVALLARFDVLDDCADRVDVHACDLTAKRRGQILEVDVSLRIQHEPGTFRRVA